MPYNDTIYVCFLLALFKRYDDLVAIASRGLEMAMSAKHTFYIRMLTLYEAVGMECLGTENRMEALGMVYDALLPMGPNPIVPYLYANVALQYVAGEGGATESLRLREGRASA